MMILDLTKPVVMGIMNLSPDSFYDGGNYITIKKQLEQVEKMVKEGAEIIDLGAVSTRPGAVLVERDEELSRLLPALIEIKKEFPWLILSVDTFRAEVATICIGEGAGMINDIYGGRYDGKMIGAILKANIPYVIMHMQGSPENMQTNPVYKNVVDEVDSFFSMQITEFKSGFSQIILDPGFGFGKSVNHNFQLLSHLDRFKHHGFPVMAGISRKSMINKALNTKPEDALNGTTVLNTIALLKGANILRVHDVKEAVQAIRLVGMMKI